MKWFTLDFLHTFFHAFPPCFPEEKDILENYLLVVCGHDEGMWVSWKKLIFHPCWTYPQIHMKEEWTGLVPQQKNITSLSSSPSCTHTEYIGCDTVLQPAPLYILDWVSHAKKYIIYYGASWEHDSVPVFPSPKKGWSTAGLLWFFEGSVVAWNFHKSFQFISLH